MKKEIIENLKQFGHRVLDRYKIQNWDIDIRVGSSGCDGITFHETKKITLSLNDSCPESYLYALLAHELAHAVSAEGHTGWFADKFTEIVSDFFDIKSVYKK